MIVSDIRVIKVLTRSCRQRYDDGMEIKASARKHGISDADMLHALAYLIRYIEQDYDNEARIFVIGPALDGRFLELILVPADEPERIIHADILQPKNYDYL